MRYLCPAKCYISSYSGFCRPEQVPHSLPLLCLLHVQHQPLLPPLLPHPSGPQQQDHARGLQGPYLQVWYHWLIDWLTGWSRRRLDKSKECLEVGHKLMWIKETKLLGRIEGWTDQFVGFCLAWRTFERMLFLNVKESIRYQPNNEQIKIGWVSNYTIIWTRYRLTVSGTLLCISFPHKVVNSIILFIW